MNECATNALVLDITQTGEYDGRVTLFTETMGKIVARAKSVFKLGGKLAGHLQPLTIARVRLVEKKGVQIVDAITVKRLVTAITPATEAKRFLAVARLIDELTQSHHPDGDLWALIVSGRLAQRELLTVLGFDPEHAKCNRCEKTNPNHFLIRDAVYVCTPCFLKIGTRSAQDIRL